MFGTNITPDPQYGIGSYTLRISTARCAKASPKTAIISILPCHIPSFSKMSDEDVKALYEYFMHEVPPVHEACAGDEIAISLQSALGP